MKPLSTIVSIILEVAKIVWGWECPGGLPLEVMFELRKQRRRLLGRDLKEGHFGQVALHMQRP